MIPVVYLGLKAEYAIETQLGGRRFGTVEVVMDTAGNVQLYDSSTKDASITNPTNPISFTAGFSGGYLTLLINNSGGVGSCDVAVSFKLIAVP